MAQSLSKFFITNRFPDGKTKSKKGRTFKFDLENNEPASQMYFCESGADGKHTEILSEHLLDRVSRMGYNQVLFLIHGFNTLPEPALKLGAKLQKLCDGMRSKEVFVVPVIWPCDADFGIIKDYWDDRRAARASSMSLSRILERFVDWRKQKLEDGNLPECMNHVSILAHSMGNLVLSEAMDAYRSTIDGWAMPFIFRNAFLMAADIPNDSLEIKEDGELIAKASKNVVVYHAIDDRALHVSVGANLLTHRGKRRLGGTGPKRMSQVPSNVYEVDCNKFNSKYDPPIGHRYFLSPKNSNAPGEVFKHVFNCLAKGEVVAGDISGRSFRLA